METIEKSDSGNIDVEDKKLKSNGDEEDNLLQINERGDAMMHVKQEENGIKQPPSMEAQIMSARAKIGEVREENERLKQLLCKIVEDYECLRKHFCEVAQEEEEEAKKSTKITPTHQENEESELVSLSLGRSSSEPKKEEKKSSNNSNDEKLNVSRGLPLGLDCKFEPDSTVTKKKSSSEYSFNEEAKEEQPTETWPPSKVLKTSISPEDEILRQIQIKKTRVSVRSRCDTPTMNDGCQWRKYGQKIAKGNPCPRAYYRCTISPNCPVRKKVQRCAEDMTILMTTYEGTHNHPLPLAATAMASTTCAAASMLQSPSLTSQPGLSSPMSANGFNFTLTQNSKPQPFYFPNSSFSNSNSLHPTVTLDLTAPPASSSHFNTFPSTSRYSPTCLNFSTYNKKNSMFLNNIGQPKSSSSSSCNQQALTDQTIAAAATKIITANPTFRSVLTAVNVDYDQASSGLNLKVGDQPLTFSSAKNESGSPASCRDTNKG